MIIQLTSAIDNTSLQIGDMAYIISTTSSGDSQFGVGTPTALGEIIGVGNDWIEVFSPSAVVTSESFLMFSKDKRVNTSGLTGYYAEVALRNDSTDEIELFALSSNVTESSK